MDGRADPGCHPLRIGTERSSLIPQLRKNVGARLLSKAANWARPPLGHGDDGIYLIGPTTGSARKLFPITPTRQHAAPPRSISEPVDNCKDREWKKVANESLLTDDDKWCTGRVDEDGGDEEENDGESDDGSRHALSSLHGSGFYNLAR